MSGFGPDGLDEAVDRGVALVRDLGRNLLAGAKLVLFRRVGVLDFRISPAAFAALVIANLAFTLAGAMLRYGLPGTLAPAALPAAVFYVPILLATALAVAAIYSRSDLLVALAVMWTAGEWVFELVLVGLHHAFIAGETSLLPRRLATPVGHLFALWGLIALWRAVRMAAGTRRPHFTFAIGLTTLYFSVFYLWVPRSELWRPLPEVIEDAAIEPLSPASEEVIHRQPALFAERLAALAPERPGVTDLYFLGVAPYAAQDVFVRELASVEKLFAERFDTAGRTLTLVNSPDTLLTQPIATATHLRAALARFGEVMNPDEDILMLFITTHGDRRHELAFDLAPLDLQQLTPSALARMLNDSGIKWKVIVVSACFSGGYVEPLRDANTVVITAAQADRTSFGCESGRDWTYFGEAYFRDALPRTHSFVDAFKTARSIVAAREARDGLEASNPQIAVGAAIAARLAALEARLAQPMR